MSVYIVMLTLSPPSCAVTRLLVERTSAVSPNTSIFSSR